MPELITSKDNKRIKELMKIQAHPRSDCFVVEGYHSVEVAYSAHCLKEVYCLEDPHLQGVNTFLVNESILKKVSKASTFEKIIGVASLTPPKNHGDRLLILDRLQDPGNVGTLLRTAASFGFHDVLLMKGTCSPFNNKVISSSEGALFHLNLFFADDASCLDSLKKEGFVIFGSALREAKSLETADLVHKKIALVLGNEGQGMSEAMLSGTSSNLKISMDTMESLNVAMAGAILMHSIYIANKTQ